MKYGTLAIVMIDGVFFIGIEYSGEKDETNSESEEVTRESD